MNPAAESVPARPAFITMVVMFLGTSVALVGNYHIYDSIGPVCFGVLSVVAFICAALLCVRDARISLATLDVA